MAWFAHEPIDAVTCCILYSRVSELGNTGCKVPSHCRTAQKDAFTETRERSEMDAAIEKTLDPIAGSPSARKSVAGNCG